ncbi:hypothetical protein [Hyphomicrobium sp. CS1BSMeth3]|uniref:DUF7736 domain-containing protein n=1 Tax=Hyphomicrobium sp. CS1BSMeth3 TaxID=1892844 RepID=UPI00093020E2|nr:hypothetical protein [Hyphomicrobium sp. CS1BSMeth3]
MVKAKEFSTPVVVSLSSGVLLCEFTDMHKAAEWVTGQSLHVHHFTLDAVWDALRMAVLAQHPDVPTDIEIVNEGNVQEQIASLIATHGPTLELAKGSGPIALNPEVGIPQHLKGRTIPIGGQ